MSDFHTLTYQEKNFIGRYEEANISITRFSRIINSTESKKIKLANYYNVLSHLNNFSEYELQKYPTFVGIISLMKLYVDKIYYSN